MSESLDGVLGLADMIVDKQADLEDGFLAGQYALHCSGAKPPVNVPELVRDIFWKCLEEEEAAVLADATAALEDATAAQTADNCAIYALARYMGASTYPDDPQHFTAQPLPDAEGCKRRFGDMLVYLADPSRRPLDPHRLELLSDLPDLIDDDPEFFNDEFLRDHLSRRRRGETIPEDRLAMVRHLIRTCVRRDEATALYALDVRGAEASGGYAR